MKFEQTGLINNPIVEEAFDYALAYLRGRHGEIELAYTQKIEAEYIKRLYVLDMDLEDRLITQDVYEGKKKALEAQHELQLQRITPAVRMEVAQLINESLAIPLELQSHSDLASPEVLAAALLMPCVRTPKDFAALENQFNPYTMGILRDLMQIKAYPAEIEGNLAAAGHETKSILLSQITLELAAIVAQATKMPDMTLAFPPKEEEKLFKETKRLWGSDKKLQKRLADVFNRAADAVASSYTLDISPEGAPQLTKHTTPPPPPKSASKKPLLGDDGF